MSTNGVVGLGTPEEFKGRYVHWDSYPDVLGRAVWSLIQNGGAERIESLHDEHPVGFSSYPEVCYCHDRGETEELLITQDEAEGYGPWFYLVNPEGHELIILYGDNTVTLDYRGIEPNWGSLETAMSDGVAYQQEG